MTPPQPPLSEAEREWRQLMRMMEDPADRARWLTTLPPAVRALAERYPDNRLYWYPPTEQIVYVKSWRDDGTVTIHVAKEFEQNRRGDFSLEVFGVDPKKLEERPRGT